MSRSAAVALFIAIFPGFLLAQDPPPSQRITHEVARGESLWSLAARYLGDPLLWPRIYEANRETLPDPDVLEPGQVLVIPGPSSSPARVESLAVAQAGRADRRDPESSRASQIRSGGPPSTQTRTDSSARGREPVEDQAAPSSTAPGLQSSPRAAITLAVPPGLVHSAEWLGPWRGVEPHLGAIRRISETKAQRTPRFPARIGEEVVIRVAGGAAMALGDSLQAFRALRRERGLGTVYQPSGVLTVSGAEGSEVRARVERVFGPMEEGDLVRPLPETVMEVGREPVPVESNVTATLLGFPRARVLPQLQSRVFLDVGTLEGVVIGDVFSVGVGESASGSTGELARLQVVLVQGEGSTAAIVEITNPDLAAGQRARLIAKMQ